MWRYAISGAVWRDRYTILHATWGIDMLYDMRYRVADMQYDMLHGGIYMLDAMFHVELNILSDMLHGR